MSERCQNNVLIIIYPKKLWQYTMWITPTLVKQGRSPTLASDSHIPIFAYIKIESNPLNPPYQGDAMAFSLPPPHKGGGLKLPPFPLGGGSGVI